MEIVQGEKKHQKLSFRQHYGCKTLSFLKLLNNMFPLAFENTCSRMFDRLYSDRECVDLEKKKTQKNPLVRQFTAADSLMCRHICIFLCPPVRYTLRWRLIRCVWSGITIFPSSWDWTVGAPAGTDKSPSSASRLIPVVFFFLSFLTNDYFQRFVLLKKKRK